VGKREEEKQAVSLRERHQGDLGVKTFPEVLDIFAEQSGRTSPKG
jgi:hypothetical protein